MTIKQFSITEAMNIIDDELHVITEEMELHLKNGTLQIKVNLDNHDTPCRMYEQRFAVHRLEHAIWTFRDENGKPEKYMVR